MDMFKKLTHQQAEPSTSDTESAARSLRPESIQPSKSLGIPLPSPTPIKYKGSFATPSLNSIQWLGTFDDGAFLRSQSSRSAVTFVPESHNVEDLQSLYEFIHEIGSGATCRVMLAMNILTKKYVALKQLRKDEELNFETFETEYKILSKLKHENIASFQDCYIDRYSYYIITDYCSGGELLDYVSTQHTFSESQAIDCIITIIKAVEYIHKKNIVHRDLKPGNLIFDKKPSLDYFQDDEKQKKKEKENEKKNDDKDDRLVFE